MPNLFDLVLSEAFSVFRFRFAFDSQLSKCVWNLGGDANCLMSDVRCKMGIVRHPVYLFFLDIRNLHWRCFLDIQRWGLLQPVTYNLSLTGPSIEVMKLFHTELIPWLEYTGLSWWRGFMPRCDRWEAAWIAQMTKFQQERERESTSNWFCSQRNGLNNQNISISLFQKKLNNKIKEKGKEIKNLNYTFWIKRRTGLWKAMCETICLAY